MTTERVVGRPSTCVHFGRTCDNIADGYASIDGQPVCHPNFSDRPDCYHLITVYHEVLGSRRVLPPADPAAVTDQLREHAYAVCVQHGIPWNDHAVALLLAGILPAHEATVREQVAQDIETADPFPYESGCSCREKAAAISRAGHPRTSPLVHYTVTCKPLCANPVAVFNSAPDRQRWIDRHLRDWGHPFDGTTTDHVVEPVPGDAG
jgi:hypothetical protein